MSNYHTPVLLNESIDILDINPSGTYVDATLGGGGHTKEILSRLSRKGRLIVFDRDSDALENAPKDDRVLTAHSNFRFVNNFIRYFGFESVDGILADLGVSSHQFDTSDRGFSFRFEAPLDMRMNRLSGLSAQEVLNSYPKEELINIFRLYGELEGSYKTADLICRYREEKRIESTEDLYEAVKRAVPHKEEHKYLAKLYQAIRIEVNGEMDSLKGFLKGALKSLRSDGVLSVITYHSLEDRMVKNFIKTGNITGEQEKDIYGRTEAPLRAILKKPVLPSEEEIINNNRARSAKLRAAKKV